MATLVRLQNSHSSINYAVKNASGSAKSLPLVYLSIVINSSLSLLVSCGARMPPHARIGFSETPKNRDILQSKVLFSMQLFFIEITSKWDMFLLTNLN